MRTAAPKPAVSTPAKVAVVVATLLLTVALVELAYGVVYYRSRHGATYYEIRRGLGATRLYVEDPDVGYRSAANLRDRLIDNPPLATAPRRHAGRVDTNELGLRYAGSLASPKPAGEIRVFSLGGSTTYGIGPSHETYPGQLQALFAHDPRVKVINAGVGGYRTIHQVQLYAKVIRRLEPDIITIHDGWNDFEDFLEPYWRPKDPHRNALFTQLRVFGSPLARLAIGQLVVRAYYAWKDYDRREVTHVRDEQLRRYEAGARDPRWLGEYEENLQMLITMAKQDGVVPMLILFPSPHFPNASAEVKAFADQDLNMWGRWDAFVVALDGIRARLRTLAQRNGIPLIDVNATFDRDNEDYRKKFRLFMDRMHLTEEGDRVLATVMYPCVRTVVEALQRKGRSAAQEVSHC